MKTDVIRSDGVHRGDPHVLASARSARLAQEARLRSGTVKMPPLPVHLALVLVKQRVEVKTKTEEHIGVVSSVVDGCITIYPPLSYDVRGFWEPNKLANGTVFCQKDIERLTLLEGPIDIVVEVRKP